MKSRREAAILISILLMSSAAGCARNLSIKESSIEEAKEGTEQSIDAVLKPLSEAEILANSETAGESEISGGKDNILLTQAPAIQLSDSLSSTLNQFEIQPGSYSWNYMENDEMVGAVACGSHPLQANLDTGDRLHIQKYHMADDTAYSVSCMISPDRLTVREWDLSQVGDTDAVEETSATYQDAFLIKLKPDKIYEIIAYWDEAKLEDNGFYGDASYVVITD